MHAMAETSPLTRLMTKFSTRHIGGRTVSSQAAHANPVAQRKGTLMLILDLATRLTVWFGATAFAIAVAWALLNFLTVWLAPDVAYGLPNRGIYFGVLISGAGLTFFAATRILRWLLTGK